MGLIPQVKCGRCDRTYSGLRSRCPYCGAHRHKKGKRVSDGDNATWKLIIGILLIVVLIAAVIVIVVTSPKDTGKDPGSSKPGGQTNNPNIDPGNDPNGTGPNGSAGLIVTDADGVAVATITIKPADNVELTASLASGTDEKPVWTSSDEAVVKVEATDDTGLKARVTGVAAGSTVITCTVGDAKVDIGVTCSADSEPGTTNPPAGPVLASKITVASPYKNPVKDFTLKVGEKVTCTATITPSTATGKVTWTVSKEGVLEIVPTDETGVKVRITCVSGVGYVTVTATIDGVSYDFRVQTKK